MREANRMIIVGMELFMGAVGIATLFLGGLGVMNVMLVSRAGTHAGNWCAHGVGRNSQIDPAAIFHGNA